MKTIMKLLIATAFLFPTVVNAGWVDKQGNKIPDSDNMKSAGDLSTQLILTDKEANVLKNWNTPSATVYLSYCQFWCLAE